MHIEFLVEELSAEAALLSIVPKILGHEVSFAIHSYQGKQDLLKKLPGMLTAYNAWLPEDWRICVLIDADGKNCKELKSRLEGFAQNRGLLTKSATSGASNFQVLNRVAVEELEAWFFGDVEALHAAYPRVSLTLGNKAKYRDPDAIDFHIFNFTALSVVGVLQYSLFPLAL